MQNRREFIQKLLAAGAIAFLQSRSAAAFPVSICDIRPAEDPWSRLPEILNRIKAPVFPNRDFNIVKFGAIAGGQSDCTNAFAGAIAECHKRGGGRVIVPHGTFVSGPIHLKSNVNLHLSDGAIIKFSRDPQRYLPLVFSRWEGMELMNYSPFIYAFNEQNLAITGSGTLDGQADSQTWWPWNGRPQYGWKEGQPNQRKARTALVEMIERRVPVAERVFGEGHYLRPQFIQPYRCGNVLIEGVTITNSPMWEVHPVLCTNITVRNVRIVSHGPNNDGCDPESCNDVLIENCFFDTGDDCIAVKSGRNADGRRLNVPTQNIVVQDCVMKDGHGGFTVGSEISGGVRNLFAENCRLDSPNLDHALRVKNNAMRGGVLEDLHFRNIEVGQVAHAVITIDFNYEEGGKGSFTPVVRNYTVQNLRSGRSKYALDIQGFPQAPIYNLRLADCTFGNVAERNIVKYVEGLSLQNVRINGRIVGHKDIHAQDIRTGLKAA